MSRPWYSGRRGKRVAISSGPATVAVVAASGAKQYRLLRFLLTASGAASTIQFKSATIAITGVYDLVAPGIFEYTFVGGENCIAGDSLNLVITGVGATVKGDVWYEEV